LETSNGRLTLTFGPAGNEYKIQHTGPFVGKVPGRIFFRISFPGPPPGFSPWGNGLDTLYERELEQLLRRRTFFFGFAFDPPAADPGETVLRRRPTGFYYDRAFRQEFSFLSGCRASPQW